MMSPNSKSLLLVFLIHLCVVCAAAFAGGNEFRNDYHYCQEAGGWFKLHRVPELWQSARIKCYHEGAVLASPLNSEIWSAMKKMVSEAKVERVYSGVHALFCENVYSSIEGVPLEQLDFEWLPNQPDNIKQTEQCLAYNSSGMEDYDCHTYLPYICFRKISVSDELTECGTVDKEYKLDARTGQCYKFHPVAVSWWNAVRICQAEGGHLAIIDNEAEADVLKELFTKHPRLLYTPFQNSASVGFKEWGYTKSWWTIHGKRLEDTDYAQWSNGQPDNGSGGRKQQCGAIFRTGKLDDVWCDEPLAFICEKSKRSLLRDIF